jgi:hypothetical protein
VVAAGYRQKGNRSCRIEPFLRAESAFERPVKRDAICGVCVLRFRKIELKRRDSCRIYPDVHAPQVPEGLNQQPGRHKEQDRQCNLAGHEHVPNPPPAATGSTRACAPSQRLVDACRAQSESRREAEHQRRDQHHHYREPDQRSID